MPTEDQSKTIRNTTAVANMSSDKIQTWDCRTSSQSNKDQVAPLVTLQEAFARTLSQSAGARLGVEFGVALRATDQMSYASFLQKMSTIPYVVLMRLEPVGEMILVHIDPRLLFPVIDLLLGGAGQAGEVNRDVTEIEDQILQNLIRLIGEELQNAWRVFNVNVKIGRRQILEQLQRLFPTTEQCTIFSYSVTLLGSETGFQVVLPGSCSTSFLRGLSRQAPPEQTAAPMGTSRLIAERMLECHFGLDLQLRHARVQATDLLNLAPGQVLKLGLPVRTPPALAVGGCETFEAVPVRSGTHRAAQLVSRLEQNPESRSL